MKLLGVIGSPIAHSLSPQIHEAALLHSQIQGRYLRISAFSAAEGFRLATELGLSGFNITAPFKETSRSLVNSVDEAAEAIGAVNTVVVRGDTFSGHNTDAHGVVHSLLAHGVNLKSNRVLVLGAGGAARAVVWGTIRAGAAVIVANRSIDKARAIAQDFGCDYSDLSLESLRESFASCNVIISTIPDSSVQLPLEELKHTHTLLDAIYRAPTELISSALQVGANVIPGSEWLLHQGEQAYSLFTGLKVPVEVMRQALVRSTTSSSGPSTSLVGMMGAGKSTVAKELAALTGEKVIDTDEEVERGGKTIREIFNTDGEQCFRELERRVISKIPSRTSQILSVGGGAILSIENRADLKELGAVVWLWGAPTLLANRLEFSRSRPLLSDLDSTTTIGARITRMLKERFDCYATVCDLIIDSCHHTPTEIAQRIYDEYHSSRLS